MSTEPASLRTLVLLPMSSPLDPPPWADHLRRPDDWGLSRWRRGRSLLRWSLRVAVTARHYDRVVVVTGGLELFFLAPLLRCQVLAVDWLLPDNPRFDQLARFGKVRFIVVRRADRATLQRRFGIDRDRTRFVAFPAPQDVGPVTDDGYAYSAGWAHRDWDTLLAAQARNELRTVIAGQLPSINAPGLTVLPPLSPVEGRKMMRAARYVVLALEDTELPSGPLVLLDALAHGKPVAVTDVGGSRDYVTDGVDALLVPPGDPDALDIAMRQLDSDAALRSRLAVGATRRAAELEPQHFWREVLER